MTSDSISGRLGLRFPVIQAPMAGGPTTPELVTAVCEWGAFGFVAGAYSTGDDILQVAQQVRSNTQKPFGINLFAPATPPHPPATMEHALAFLAPFHRDLGLGPPEMPEVSFPNFDEQYAAALESGASVLSFTFGVLPPEMIRRVKSRGMLVFGTATTVEEARALEAAGVDAVVAQGSEAGAHRGTFSGDFGHSMIGTMALVPQVRDAIHVPVIASGGIMDGRGVLAALALGADAVQMGTAFLTCHESGAPEVHKQAILDSRDDQTRITTAFSGRPARGITNLVVSEAEQGSPDAILPYPYQNLLTRQLRTAAANQDRPEYLSLWAGQGAPLSRRSSVTELLDRLEAETKQLRGAWAVTQDPSSAADQPGHSGGQSERWPQA